MTIRKCPLCGKWADGTHVVQCGIPVLRGENVDDTERISRFDSRRNLTDGRDRDAA